mmetsp:Transcript_61507/g.170544  ORF Transcript_61507/g.170544 Transcript_61507/m.170544 type:complete len:209 (-) Transcript_61507:1042-1668(-)
MVSLRLGHRMVLLQIVQLFLVLLINQLFLACCSCINGLLCRKKLLAQFSRPLLRIIPLRIGRCAELLKCPEVLRVCLFQDLLLPCHSLICVTLCHHQHLPELGRLCLRHLLLDLCVRMSLVEGIELLPVLRIQDCFLLGRCCLCRSLGCSQSVPELARQRFCLHTLGLLQLLLVLELGVLPFGRVVDLFQPPNRFLCGLLCDFQLPGE